MLNPADQRSSVGMPSTVTEPWAYKPQPWDEPEVHEYMRHRTVPEAAVDEIEAITLCRDQDDELERKRVLFTFEEQSFKIGSTLILNSQIRYVTTKTGELSTATHVILLSYRHDNNIKCCYIHEPEPAMAEKILNTFRKLQYESVRHLPDSTQKDEIYNFFAPKLVCRVNVETNLPGCSRVDKKTWILTLDEECFCLFRKEYQTQPDHQVNFWKDTGIHVVDKMALIHATNKLVIETQAYQYTMDAQADEVRELIDKIKTIKPKPKASLADLASIVEYCRDPGMAQQRAPLHIPAADTYVNINDTDTAHQRAPLHIPAADTYMNINDTDTAISESARLYFRSFKDDIEAAYAEGERNPDWQAMWAPNDEPLRQILEQNLVQQRDARSGGLNPDDISHFQSCLTDIDDKLFSQDIEAAVSTLRSLRDVFVESSYREVRPILEEDDYMLLKKIFFKILKDQASS